MLILWNSEYLCKLNTTGSFPAESLLVELMEEHCSRPDEMCNRVQNIFAIWNRGWKGCLLAHSRKTIWTCILFLLFALYVAKLCMMVTIMHIFCCNLHHTLWQGLRDFNFSPYASSSARAKQMGRSVKNWFYSFDIYFYFAFCFFRSFINIQNIFK